MSYASEIKQEIANNTLKPCCIKAQLAALVQLCCTMVIHNKNTALVFKSENPTTAKRFLMLVKTMFDVTTELSMIHKMNLKKNNIYQVNVYGPISDILVELGLMGNHGLMDHPYAFVVRKECCARAYLAGAFMASGSISNPIKTNYHLEIVTTKASHGAFIEKLLNRFDCHAKTITRRHQIVVYVKMSERIGDFIRLIGASDSLMKFEDIRIQRDFRNNLTRLDNCEIANDMKTQKAAGDQMSAIQKLFDYGLFDQCDEKVRSIIDLRINYPDASLNELCGHYQDKYGMNLSKSGLKHRLNKINELVDDYERRNADATE